MGIRSTWNSNGSCAGKLIKAGQSLPFCDRKCSALLHGKNNINMKRIKSSKNGVKYEQKKHKITRKRDQIKEKKAEKEFNWRMGSLNDNIFLRLRCKILSLEIYEELLDLSDPPKKISLPCFPRAVHAQTKQIPSDFKDK